MNFHLPIPHINQDVKIEHQDKIMLLGSCFSENMSARLKQSKWNICANPHGILFNPNSISKSVAHYLNEEKIEASDLFYLNEIWNHWDFHSRFSNFNQETALLEMNASIQHAAQFLKEADWLVITLGSAFQYFLKADSMFNNSNEIPVANCHRAAAPVFEKRMLSILEMTSSFELLLTALKVNNPKIKIIFTVSPVRHIRDGLIENNQSKARLLELVHHFVENQSNCFYFPSYELIIDVLRDYRFFEQDMVHPNQQATDFVWENFVSSFMSEKCQNLIADLKNIDLAFQHKPRFQETNAHLKLKETYLRKVLDLKKEYPYLDLDKELNYFSKQP